MHQRTLLGAMVLVIACGGNPPDVTRPVQPAEPLKAPAKTAELACSYQVTGEGSTVGWTAFKFTEKTGVEGRFDAVSVTPGRSVDASWKALDGVGFRIDTGSVNSENPERDARIQAQLFGTMQETTSITGKIKANSKGRSTVTLTMNGTTHPMMVDVSEADGLLTLRGTLDLVTWDGGAAIAALNAVCEDLHRGSDGVSKLWSEVEVKATVPVVKTCK